MIRRKFMSRHQTAFMLICALTMLIVSTVAVNLYVSVPQRLSFPERPDAFDRVWMQIQAVSWQRRFIVCAAASVAALLGICALWYTRAHQQPCPRCRSARVGKFCAQCGERIEALPAATGTRETRFTATNAAIAFSAITAGIVVVAMIVLVVSAVRSGQTVASHTVDFGPLGQSTGPTSRAAPMHISDLAPDFIPKPPPGFILEPPSAQPKQRTLPKLTDADIDAALSNPRRLTDADVAAAISPRRLTDADMVNAPRVMTDAQVRGMPPPANPDWWLIDKATVRPRIVFLCNVRGNMGGKFGQLRSELMKAVDHLPPDSDFNVIFYSDGKARPVYANLVVASPENRLRALEAAAREGGGAGDSLVQALQSAYDQNPETIYLLSDGQHEALSQYEIRLILRRSNPEKTIRFHAVLLGNPAEEAVKFWQPIAEENGGQVFRVANGM